MLNYLLNFLAAGIAQLPWWGNIIVALITTHITIMTVTIFLHRSETHRALTLHPILKHFFRFWAWVGTGMVTKEWVAIHRKHHAESDTKDDPHSPQIVGIMKVLFQGTELYRKASKDREMVERYGHGTPDDWIERNVYSHRRGNRYGVFLMLIIDLILFGLPGLCIWAVQMMWIPFLAAGVINGAGHYWGYRNFECPDAATNLMPWGIIIGGEELHNNHHTYGTSAKFSVKWWEFDIGWLYISLFRLLGLAKVKRTPPKTKSFDSKQQIDEDTLTAVLKNRFQLLAQYTKDVIQPVFRAEKRKGNRVAKCRRTKKLFIRNHTLVSETQQIQLEKALQNQGSLKTVYQFSLRLQDIWAKTNASKDELIDAIKEWCSQAEKSGVEALHRFAATLRGYGLVS